MRRICLVALVLLGCGGSSSGTVDQPGGAGGAQALPDAATTGAGGSAAGAGGAVAGTGGIGGTAGAGAISGAGGGSPGGTSGSAPDASPPTPDTMPASYPACAYGVRNASSCSYLDGNSMLVERHKDGLACVICFPPGPDSNPDMTKPQVAGCIVSPLAGVTALCVMFCGECK